MTMYPLQRLVLTIFLYSFLHQHNVARGNFAPTPEWPGLFEPMPAPQLSRTPGYKPRPKPKAGGDTHAVLVEMGFSDSDISNLLNNKFAIDTSAGAKM